MTSWRRSIGPALLMIGLALTLASPEASAGTASVTDLTFPAVAYSHDAARTSTATMTLTAAETASTGWNVTVQSGEFVYSGPHGGANLPAANLAVVSAAEPTANSGQAVDPTNGPRRAAGAFGSLNVARKMLTTQPLFGVGSYSQDITVELTVPALARVGTYTATLTTTMTSGP